MTDRTGHLFECNERYVHGFKLSRATITLDSVVRIQKLLLKEFDGVHGSRKPARAQGWSFVMRDNNAMGSLSLCCPKVPFPDCCVVGRVIGFYCTWIANISDPSILQPEQCTRSNVNKTFQRTKFTTDVNTLYSHFHVLEVFGKRPF